MFKEIGQLTNLMRQLPKIKEEMENLQQRLGRITAEGDAGGGMVKATVNGKLEIVTCTLAEDALKRNDREMLEDLIRSAVNLALQKVRVLVAEETAKAAGNLGLPFGLPSGMGLPGLGG